VRPGEWAAPLQGGHAVRDVTSGRKQDTGRTGSVIRTLRARN
jgi:hypothetical protein